MLLSVIIPAFNEEKYLDETLSRITESIVLCRCSVELIVVDNGSADRTADAATAFGAIVINDAVHNVGHVRNVGARAAHGDVLVFIDADTLVPKEFLDRVAEAMSNPACLGGSPDVAHRVSSRLLRVYFGVWRSVGLRMGMAQGAAQFCRAAAFEILNGYDESLFMGEDVDFYWRLQKLSRKSGGHLKFLGDIRVFPSPRRFENASVWRTLLWTNPVFIAPLRKKRSVWTAWYVRPPR